MLQSKRTEELEAAEAPVQSKRPRRAAAAVAAAKSTEQQQTQSAPKAGSKARSAKKPAAAGEGPQQGEQPSAAAAETKRKAAAKPAAKGKSTAAGSKEKPPYYLVKSEPDEFSIDALKARPNQTEGWEGECLTASQVGSGCTVCCWCCLAYELHLQCEVHMQSPLGSLLDGTLSGAGLCWGHALWCPLCNPSAAAMHVCSLLQH